MLQQTDEFVEAAPGEVPSGGTIEMRKLVVRGAYKGSLRLHSLFRSDMRKAWLMSEISDEKEKLLFDIAWGERHEFGQVAVFDFYGDLSELLRD